MPDKKLAVKKPIKKVIATKATVKKAVVAKSAVTKPAPKAQPKETGLKISVYSTKGKVLESYALPKEIFGVEVNDKLMTQAVKVYQANQRRGTSKTKSRGEVNVSTKKIYRQKGTGRARHGAASAPIFVGGGIAFGPRQRDFSLSLNKKARRASLFSALSGKLKDGEIKLISGLEKLEPKTKNMAEVLENLSLNEKKKRVLLVTPRFGKDFENVIKAARNLEGVTVTASNVLNTYEVLACKQILLMKNSVDVMKETFLK